MSRLTESLKEVVRPSSGHCGHCGWTLVENIQDIDSLWKSKRIWWESKDYWMVWWWPGSWLVGVLTILPTTCCNKSGIPRQSIRSVGSLLGSSQSTSVPLSILPPAPPAQSHLSGPATLSTTTRNIPYIQPNIDQSCLFKAVLKFSIKFVKSSPCLMSVWLYIYKFPERKLNKEKRKQFKRNKTEFNRRSQRVGLRRAWWGLMVNIFRNLREDVVFVVLCGSQSR